MLISDLSSDVCSSDLHGDNAELKQVFLDRLVDLPAEQGQVRHRHDAGSVVIGEPADLDEQPGQEELRRQGGDGEIEALDAHRRQAEHHTDHSGDQPGQHEDHQQVRSEEHTSELQSLMRISYAVFCLKKKKKKKLTLTTKTHHTTNPHNYP